MLSRRDFLKAGTAVGLPWSPLASAVAQALPEIESSSWCACVINCGQRCPVRCFTKKGQVIRIETHCLTQHHLQDNFAPASADAQWEKESIRMIASNIRWSALVKEVKENSKESRGMKPLKQSLITGRESAINTVMMQFIGSIAPANNLLSAPAELGSVWWI